MIEEQKIIDKLKSGDKNAFETIFNNYYASLCEFASIYVTPSESEEIVQDFMFYIWENREYLTLEDNLRPYFFTSIKNKCFNHIRKKQSDQRIHVYLYDKLKDEFENPNSYLENELYQKIQMAIEDLPETYRETFKLSRFSELTNKQLANKMGISIKAVEYRITQSLKILREKLKPYLQDF